jgi:hypothetical protein
MRITRGSFTTANAINVLTVLLLAAAVWRAGPALASHYLPDEEPITPQGAARATLLVAFQASDCASYAAFITDWRRLGRDGLVTVIGVPMNVSNPNELEQTLEEFAIQFPMRIDLAPQTEELLQEFHSSQTPAAILLDANGRPRMLIPARQTSARKVDVQAMVSSYIHLTTGLE